MEIERLEKISDKARKGESISFNEAIEVIKYQEELKRSRKPKKSVRQFFNGLLKKLKR